MGAEDRGEFNQAIISQFLAANTFNPDNGNPNRTVTQRHLVSDPVDLRVLIETLLADYRVRDPNE